MKLYYAPGACSLAPHIVLRETALPFELDRVDFATRKTASGEDFNKVNPKSQVPTLKLDSGETLTEGPVIMQYLADRKPESGLVPPAGSMERYRVQEWLNYVTSELHKTFAPMFNDRTPAAFREMIKEKLNKQFDYLDRHFAKNQFLAGSKFTVADAYAFTVIRWSRAPVIAIDIAKWPNLMAYMDRIAARPRVHEAMKVEGLVAA